MGIPATSAFVERFFSKTGYIMRPHRRSMADKLAEDLFFCKENLSFVDTTLIKLLKLIFFKFIMK